MVPIAEYCLELSKQHFWDSVNQRHGWDTSKRPIMCPCRSKFYIQDSMTQSAWMHLRCISETSHAASQRHLKED